MLQELSGFVHTDTTNTAGDNRAPRPQSDEKLYKPKPEMVAKVHERSPPEEDKNAAEVAPMEDSQQLDFTAYLRFDERGMVLPHSILGSLEDFHSYLEAKGEKNLLKQIPKPVRGSASGARRGPRRDTTEGGSAQIPLKILHQRSSQSNALQRWDAHMTNRRQKQEELSYFLNRPVENLVMNQAKYFRDTQEQREILSRVIPLTHSGYGYRVGSEFWSVTQRFGDELSGITATLTQTERGQQNPSTYVGHPSSIQMEMGIISTGAESPASWAWSQSAYLQHRSQELQDVLQDMGIKKPDISKLEVIGTAVPLTSSPEHQSLLLQKEKEEKQDEMKQEKLDTPAQTDYDQLKALPFPALRIHGQLASWNGHPTSDKGEVGISTSVFFESQTGEIVSTDLELHNKGSTVIFYSWHKLPVPQCFSYLSSQNTSVHFYFKSTSGVILPGETQRVEFIFKSEEPGLWTELWQLRTHPLLLQGALIQVRLSGTAFKQDKTADQRCFLESKLEKAVVEKLCRSLMVEIVGRLHTPERPNSPSELYITEELLFQKSNPKLQYHYQPVEDLKTLWQKVNPGASWDFSVDTLRQAVLSLPDAEPVKEESFSQLYSLYLQLSEPADLQHHLLTTHIIGRQLWIKLLDHIGYEATRLRHVMGLPDKETWADVATPSPSDDKVQNKRENNSSKNSSPAAVSLLKERKMVDAGEKQGKNSKSRADIGLESTMEIQSVDPETILTYRRTLHKKVYAWMEDLVDNLCDLMEDVHVGDGGHNTNCCA